MLNELKHPEGGAVTGVLSITKIDGKTGEVTEYPAQYNHLTRWGLRAYNMGYDETPYRQGVLRVQRVGLIGLNRSIPPEDEVAAFSISNDNAVFVGMVHIDAESNRYVEPEKHGHVYKYAYTHPRDETFELSVFSLGWYNSTNTAPGYVPSNSNPIPRDAYWVPFNVITVRDAQARPSTITLNRGDKLNLTYRLIIKQDPSQRNTLQFQYKGRQHTVRIVTVPYTTNIQTSLYTPNRATARAEWWSYTPGPVATTAKHDALPSMMMPFIPDNSEWRRKHVLRFPADTFISDNVQKFEFYRDGFLHTLTFDPPLSKARGDVWEFSWITELHDRKTS